MISKNNCRNGHNLIQFQFRQKENQGHSRKCMRTNWMLKIWQMCSAPRKDRGKGDLKKIWMLESHRPSLVWVWDKAENHSSKDVNVVLSCFYDIFLSFIGLTRWLLLKIHPPLGFSRLLILHWRTTVLRRKMSESQASLFFAHLGQKKKKKSGKQELHLSYREKSNAFVHYLISITS